MPWKSKKQQAWGNSPAGVKALGGKAKVDEWNQATEEQPGGFAALPKKIKSPVALPKRRKPVRFPVKTKVLKVKT
jgi:hypothetical protein